MRYIDPLKDIGKLLLEVEKPNRYIGGEYGRLAKRDAVLQMLIAFPDLYEIGMSNQALRILYNNLNQIEAVSCDRAFAPAPDFEALLKKQGLPLYGLDTGICLADLDILLFTLGYELGITGVLTMLEAGAIPLHAAERKACHPIVIMGGPCVSNPIPYARFIDAFWIGEAEAGFFELSKQLLALKKAGAERGDVLTLISEHPAVWVQGKARVKRAIDTRFAFRKAAAAVFPVPSMKVIQHHGAVEIMRGCPNGCRFCHAGYWYRPMRQKNIETIQQETAAFITQGGYREISLSSLSSGDFRHLGDLVDILNQTYGLDHISFQLPSLRVSTFSLPLLAKISEVRKSGLTFAVETPVDAWQLSINKEVSRANVTAILQEAKKQGWRGAKFYFMIGLPAATEQENPEHTEEEEIVNFILEIARRTGMHFNINVGTFVPKPHTPYQWAAQLDEAKAWKKLEYIRLKLKPFGHKVGIQDPFISVIEGLISRGDERVGNIIEKAYLKGCRLDAWTEFMQKNIWQALLTEQEALIQDILGNKSLDIPLAWQCIDSGVSLDYLKKELQKSINHSFSSPCTQDCTHSCGICNKETKYIENNICRESSLSDTKNNTYISNIEDDNNKNVLNNIHDNNAFQVKEDKSVTWRILFTFEKKGAGIFHPHLTLMEIFSMAFLRAGIPVLYSQGFNPLPKLEIASPLSIGIEADAEIAVVDTSVFLSAQDFQNALNATLPEGIHIKEAMHIFIPYGSKKHSVSSLLWGYAYKNQDSSHTNQIDYVRVKDEKAYRLSITGPENSVYGLHRHLVLAKNLEDPDKPESYFKVYTVLYPQ